MLRISAVTKLMPEEAIKRAVEFFGPGGYGLEVKDRSETCATFEGGGGSIQMITCAEGKGSSAEFTTTEWDQQVKDFISRIA